MKRLLSFITLLLAMVSCSQEQDPTTNSSNQEVGVPISLNLRAEADSNTLETLLGISEDELKTITFDLSGTNPKVNGAASTLKSHTFFRKKGSAFVGYAEITWSYVRRVGSKVHIEARNVNVTLQNTGGVEPLVGEDWYIASILGGGRLDASKTKVDFAYDQTTDMAMSPGQIRVPMLTNWTKLETILDTNGATPRVVSGAELSFKPQGVLYRLELTNLSGEHLAETKVRLETEASSTLGAFDFSLAANLESDIERSSYRSAFVHSTTKGSIEYIERPIAPVSAGAKTVALAWGMPFSTTSADNLHVGLFYPHRHVKKTSGAPGNMRYFAPVVWTEQDINGKVVHLKGEITRPALPLEYFASSHPRLGSSPTRYALNIATNQYPALTIPLGYELPGSRVWYIPYMSYDVSMLYGSRTFDLNPISSFANTFLGRSYTGRYIARQHGGRGGYALLFSGVGDNLRSAWRFEPYSDASSPSGWMLRVTARWLGASDATPFSTIADEGFWTSGHSEDVTLTFFLDQINYPGPTAPYLWGEQTFFAGYGSNLGDTFAIDGSRPMNDAIILLASQY